MFKRTLVAFALILLTILHPAAAVARPSHISFRVAVWNEKSFPSLSQRAYREDILSARSGWLRLPALAYLGSEFTGRTGELQLARAWARRPGWELRGANRDTIEMFHLRSDLHLGKTTVSRLHGDLGHHSPARYLVLTFTRVNGLPVAFISLHLTNGCEPGKPYRAVRCRALRRDLSKVTALVKSLRSRGVNAVVGGDLNTNAVPPWAHLAHARHLRSRDLMQLAVVPAAGYRARLSNVRTARTHSDHPLVSARVALWRVS